MSKKLKSALGDDYREILREYLKQLITIPSSVKPINKIK